MTLTLFWALLLVSLSSVFSHKIAIVGGGVGGTSNAYFLRQLMGVQARIKVFERGVVGGRKSEIQIGGESYDSGASIIHSENFYAKALTQKVGLKVKKLGGNGGTGFYDGSQFVLLLTGSTLGDKFKILRRYGFGVTKVVNEAEKMVENLKRIYCLQSNKVAFKSAAELLNATSSDFLNKTGTTMRDHLKSLGISDKIQNELVAAAMHSNYNQDLSVNAFVGFVSLAGGLVGSLWRVEGGNYQLPAKILEASGAELVRAQVRSITRTGTGYTLTYTAAGDTEETEDFDAVVIATPLHNANIAFPDDIDITPNIKPFQRTVATFVNGILAPLVSGVENPSDILTVTSKDKIIFSSIGFKGTGTPDNNYKVFSKERLTEEEINTLFSKVNEVKVADWSAYPKYSVPDVLPKFELSPGLYYINAIESAASAIEMSCIGSKNVALLVYQYLEKIEGGSGETVCRSNDMVTFKEEL